MRAWHRTAAVVLAALVACEQVAARQKPSSAGPLATELESGLMHRLDAIARSLDGVLGFAIVDLTTGEQIAARFDREPFPTASTIKLALLYELLKQSEEGRLEIDRPSPLGREAVVGGSGVLQHLSAPLLSLRDHAALMIVLSDNTATNVVIDAVGMAAVGARMQALGLQDIQLRRKMMDTPAARRGDENIASPASLARVATLLWKGEGLGEANRDGARRMLRAVRGAIRAAVPAQISVASKTGELDGVRAEAGIVELDGHPFAVAVMTTYLKSDPDGVRAIRDVASAAFDYFNRLAHGGKYGRQIPQ